MSRNTTRRPATRNSTLAPEATPGPVPFRLAAVDFDAACETPTTASLPLAGWCGRTTGTSDAAPVRAEAGPAPAGAAAAKPPRDRSGDATRYRAGLTTRARLRREGAASLPWAWSLDVRAIPTTLRRAVAEALGGTSRTARDGTAAIVTAPHHGPADGAPTGTGGQWLVTQAALGGGGAGTSAAEKGARTLRVTSPVLRGPVMPEDGGALRPVTAITTGACAPAGGAAPLPYGATPSALPGVRRMVDALRAHAAVRVAPDATLAVSYGIAGVTPRQLANLCTLLCTAGPYLDAAMRGLDGEAYRRDRAPVSRAPRVVSPEALPEGVVVDVLAAAPGQPAKAPRKPRAVDPRAARGWAPPGADTTTAAPALVRPMPPEAAEAMRALAASAGRASTAPATPEYMARVAAVWGEALAATGGASALPCMVDLAGVARGVVTLRLPATLSGAEFVAWVEALALLVARALSQPRMSFRNAGNAVDSQKGATQAARVAQGLRRLLHDAGMVGRTGPCAEARAWLLHRILGPVESAPAKRLRGVAKAPRKRAPKAPTTTTGAEAATLAA